MKVVIQRSMISAFALLVASGGVASSKTVTIRLDTYAGPQHTVNRNGLEVWAKQVEKASKGDLKVKISYPPVDPRNMLDRVRSGIADAAWASHGYTTGRFVLTKMVELPRNGGNAEQGSRAFWRVYNKEFAGLGEHKGVVPLALFVHGPGMLHTRKPIESSGDLKGLKIRTGAGVQGEIAKRLGLVTVSAPVTKAQELLSQGVADGVMFSLETIKSFSLGNYVKYHYRTSDNLYTSSMTIAMNKKFLNRLSNSQKEVLWGVSGEKLSGLIGSTWDKADKAAMDAFGADSVITFKGDLKAKIDAALVGMDEQWIKEAKEAGAKNPSAALEMYRNQVRNAMKSN